MYYPHVCVLVDEHFLVILGIYLLFFFSFSSPFGMNLMICLIRDAFIVLDILNTFQLCNLCNIKHFFDHLPDENLVCLYAQVSGMFDVRCRVS